VVLVFAIPFFESKHLSFRFCLLEWGKKPNRKMRDHPFFQIYLPGEQDTYGHAENTHMVFGRIREGEAGGLHILSLHGKNGDTVTSVGIRTEKFYRLEMKYNVAKRTPLIKARFYLDGAEIGRLDLRPTKRVLVYLAFGFGADLLSVKKIAIDDVVLQNRQEAILIKPPAVHANIVDGDKISVKFNPSTRDSLLHMVFADNPKFRFPMTTLDVPKRYARSYQVRFPFQPGHYFFKAMAVKIGGLKTNYSIPQKIEIRLQKKAGALPTN